MARLISVALTEPQVRARSKTVTRRMGWHVLKPGDRLTLCRKVMGRRRGEPLVRIVDVQVLTVRREHLDEITPAEFVEFFCNSHKGCTPTSTVTRIEWRYCGVDRGRHPGPDPGP